MQISDLAAWVRRPRRAVGRAVADEAPAEPRVVRRDRPRVPEPRPAGRHAVGRRGAAHQDDPPPRSSLTDVTYVFDEPTAGLHPHDVRKMNDLLRRLRDQGEHGAGGRARAGDDPDRRPRGRPRPRRRGGGRHGLLRGRRRRAARQRHAHRAPPRRPGPPQGQGARAHRRDRDPRRQHPQPPRRRRRRADGRPRRRDRGGGLGQELAHPRRAGAARRGDGDRPDPRSAALGAATRQPTPVCWTRSARPSRRRTGSSRRCSAPTPRGRARRATASASSTPTWA